jgi:hypothetical protein
MNAVQLSELNAKVDKLIANEKITSAKIEGLQQFVRDLAIKSLKDTQETSEFCNRLKTYILDHLRS